VFTERVITTAVATPFATQGVDVDSDGDTDVLFASGNGLIWAENNGSAVFALRTVSSLGTTWQYAVDMDGDGDVDVVSDSATVGTVFYLENTQCHPGFASVTGNTPCTTCAAGTYSAFNGSTVCYPCPAGTYSAFNGSTVCYPCPAGTYSAFNGSTVCYPCPARMSSTANGTQCVCGSADDAALMALYTSAGGSSWKNMSGWPTNGIAVTCTSDWPVCYSGGAAWRGVVCSGSTVVYVPCVP
jgi:hypothetical protein